MTSTDQVTVVATDGSALGNPGPGGWAWWVSPTSWGAGCSQGRATNNAMELTAIAEALAQLEGDINVLADSEYAINAVTKWCHGWKRNGWKTKAGKPVANREVIEKIMTLSVGRKVTYTWVRGHDGHFANERADALARTAAGRKPERPVRYGPEPAA